MNKKLGFYSGAATGALLTAFMIYALPQSDKPKQAEAVKIEKPTAAKLEQIPAEKVADGPKLIQGGVLPRDNYRPREIIKDPVQFASFKTSYNTAVRASITVYLNGNYRSIDEFISETVDGRDLSAFRTRVKTPLLSEYRQTINNNPPESFGNLSKLPANLKVDRDRLESVSAAILSQVPVQNLEDKLYIRCTKPAQENIMTCTL